ncbi:hypothetical protein BaRGS_00010490, partial [Batillaria attramentaria]
MAATPNKIRLSACDAKVTLLHELAQSATRRTPLFWALNLTESVPITGKACQSRDPSGAPAPRVTSGTVHAGDLNGASDRDVNLEVDLD